MLRANAEQKYIGRKFHLLTVTAYSHRDPKNAHHYFYRCKCDCGTEKVARLSCLQQGTTQSCGCLGRERRMAAAFGNQYTRLGYGVGAMNRLRNQYVYAAVKRGIAFLLTKPQFAELTSGDCFYCGARPQYIKRDKNGHGEYIYNGIDRVDNAKPYTVENCVSACRPCNSKKNAISKEMIAKLHERLFTQGTTAVPAVAA